MKTEFRKADASKELRSLMAFDRRVFPASDCFDADYWRECEAWWMLIDGVKAGCCAFEKNVGAAKGSLYIGTTGILPKYRNMGFGRLLKAWEIAYARHHRYARIAIHTRRSNIATIALNRSFGFRIIRTVKGYYTEPDEAAVSMELNLS